MKMRKMIFNGIIYNVMTDEELNEFVREIELKKELDLQHEKLMRHHEKIMSIDDFAKKHRLIYGNKNVYKNNGE